MGQSSKKVWHAIVMAVNQTTAKKTTARDQLLAWHASFGHEPNMPLKCKKHERKQCEKIKIEDKTYD